MYLHALLAEGCQAIGAHTELLVGRKWRQNCFRCGSTRTRELEREREQSKKEDIREVRNISKCTHVLRECSCTLTTFEAGLWRAGCREGREVL